MMEQNYLEQMEAHIDEGGQLSHRNGIDLFKEVARLKKELREFGDLYDQEDKKAYDQIKALQEKLSYAAETFDLLNEHTHPSIECDAIASECRAVLQSPNVHKQDEVKK